MTTEKLITTGDVPQFDPDVSPANPHNRDVAEKLGVEYDPRKNFYVDEDGALTHDRFGQPL